MSTASLIRASCGYESRMMLDWVASGACAMRLGAREAVDMEQARFTFLRLGCVNLLHYRAVGLHTGERTRAHILQDDAPFFLLCVPIGARYTVSYRGHVENAPAQSFVFLSTDTPFVTVQRGMTQQSSFATAVLRLPAAPLRQRIATIDDLCGHFIPMAPGMATAMRSTFDWALGVGSVDECTGNAIGAGLFETICAYAEQTAHLHVPVRHNRSSLERTLERARGFIEENLADANLSTADVARYCRVSTRYLHRAFTAQDESASHYIRERRLQRCQQALHDPALAHRTVFEIAASWGFADPCHFSKAYKLRFGIAPSLDRCNAAKETKLHS
ncbi:MAG: helix-turn-helix domain-containing protein [Steroidobacteraceae bacterium]